MYHLNNATGEPGPCTAQPGNCPFGGESNHFETKDEARQAYEDSQTLFTSVQRVSPKGKLEGAEAKLREAIASGEDLEAARARWQEASLEYAASPEGQAYYSARADGVGRAAEAARYFQLEGARRMVASFDSEDLLDAMGAPLQAAAVPQLKNPVDWNGLPEATSFYGTSSTLNDLKDYQARLDAFLVDPDGATEETLRKLHPSWRAFGKMRYSGGPVVRHQTPTSSRNEYPIESREWSKLMETHESYIHKAADMALSHPAATPDDFIVVAGGIDDGFAFNHPSAPLKAREEILAKASRGKSMPEDMLDNAREFRPSSNRMALYLAAHDEDAFHRGEAFNQVVMSGMETFTEEDRVWMAKNLDKFPTSEGTVGTLKTSLRMWAKAYADVEEREKLLELLPEDAPQVEEPRRLFRRRKPAELER